MSVDTKKRDLVRGEVRSKIHWGADIEEVSELLRSHGIEGEEANSVIADAIAARRSAIRKKASIALAFAVVGLAVSITYFAIQGFVGFVVIGFGPILMALVGLGSLAMAGRSLHRFITGEAPGPV